MTTDRVREAINLAKSGRKDEARAILINLLKDEPDNEVAYFWYVDTLLNKADKIQALEEFLKRYPGHARTLKALKKLQGQPDIPQQDPLSGAQELAAAPPAGQPLTVTTPPPAPPTGSTAAQTGFADPEEAAAFDDIIDLEIASTAPGDTSDLIADVLEIDGPSQPQIELPPSDRISYSERVARIQNQQGNQEASRPLRRTLTIALGILLLGILCAVAFYPTVANSKYFMSNETRYARDMEPIIEKIDSWTSGPVAEWEELMGVQVYDGRSETYREMLYYNMKMGTPDVVVARRLVPVASSIRSRGEALEEDMSALSPPVSIEGAHVLVLACVSYETDWANEIVEFLENNISPELGEDPCGTFSAAYEQIKLFVEEYK